MVRQSCFRESPDFQGEGISGKTHVSEFGA